MTSLRTLRPHHTLPTPRTESRVRYGWLLLLLTTILSISCQYARNEEGHPTKRQLTVLVAMSLKEPLEELAQAYENDTGVKVNLQFGSTNKLAAQVEAAQSQDVFVSANEAWMNHLVDAGLVEQSSVHPVASNRLVAVARKDAQLQVSSLQDLAAHRTLKLAIGDPRGVPAGKYAKQAMLHTQTWETLQSRLVPGAHVRVALALAEARDDVVGLVYRTDVAQSQQLQVLFEVPPEQTGSIVSLMGAVHAPGKKPQRAALDFIAYCRGAHAHVFSSHGFVLP